MEGISPNKSHGAPRDCPLMPKRTREVSRRTDLTRSRGRGKRRNRSNIYCIRAGKNTAKIIEYIANQIEEDKTVEQMTITELLDPFKQ